MDTAVRPLVLYVLSVPVNSICGCEEPVPNVSVDLLVVVLPPFRWARSGRPYLQAWADQDARWPCPLLFRFRKRL
jgi:hypothetical protein